MQTNHKAFTLTAAGYTPQEHRAIVEGCAIAQERLKDEIEEVRLLKFWEAAQGGCHAMLISKASDDGTTDQNTTVLDLSGLDSDSAVVAVADLICELAFRFEVASLTAVLQFDGRGLA